MDEHRGLPHDLPEYVPNWPVPAKADKPAPRIYTALCVGGPADGQWRTVEGRMFFMAEVPKVEFTTTAVEAITEPFVQHTYHLDQAVMFGFSAWIAVCERQFRGSTERNKAVLRALLQRDVAAQMGVL